MVPIGEPPDATVYQLIMEPADIAFKFEFPPHEIEDGEAVTEDGAGFGFTVIVTDVREAETQPTEDASA